MGGWHPLLGEQRCSGGNGGRIKQSRGTVEIMKWLTAVITLLSAGYFRCTSSLALPAAHLTFALTQRSKFKETTNLVKEPSQLCFRFFNWEEERWTSLAQSPTAEPNSGAGRAAAASLSPGPAGRRGNAAAEAEVWSPQGGLGGPPTLTERAAARSKAQPQTRARGETKTTLQERGTGTHREKEMACSASGAVAEFLFVGVFLNLSFLLCRGSASLWRGLCSHHPLGFGTGGTEGLPALLSSRCSPGMTWSCRHHSLKQAHSLPQLSFSYPSERQGSLK